MLKNPNESNDMPRPEYLDYFLTCQSMITASLKFSLFVVGERVRALTEAGLDVKERDSELIRCLKYAFMHRGWIWPIGPFYKDLDQL